MSCVSFGTSTRRPLNVPFGRPQVGYRRPLGVNGPTEVKQKKPVQQCPDFCKKKRHQICENHSDHLYKSQTTFQCRSLFPSWVIRPPIAASVPYFIFLCCFIDFHKNGTNN